MLVGMREGKPIRFVAAHLEDETLHDQFLDAVEWVYNQPEKVTASKFNVDMAWFRECWWEMSRRGFIMVN